MTQTMLVIATVTQSLVLQSPESWAVARSLGLSITFAAGRDEWSPALAKEAEYVETSSQRSVRPFALWRMATSLHRVALIGEWDLVQVQTPLAGCLWRLVAPQRMRRRTVYVVHGFHFHKDGKALWNAVSRLVERLLLRRCMAMAVVSNEDFVSALELRGRTPRPMLWHLPGAGIDVEGFASAKHIPRDRDFALFCGELNDNKDPMLALRAVEAARRLGSNLDAVVIGDGPLGAQVKGFASTRPWVSLVSQSKYVSAWMARASVLLAPSRREGLPRVIVEALAAGVPVIARSNRGSRELLADGFGTLMRPEANVFDWAQAITAHISARVDTESAGVGAEARRRRAQHYGLDAFCSSYEALLRHCLTMLGTGRE